MADEPSDEQYTTGNTEESTEESAQQYDEQPAEYEAPVQEQFGEPSPYADLTPQEFTSQDGTPEVVEEPMYEQYVPPVIPSRAKPAKSVVTSAKGMTVAKKQSASVVDEELEELLSSHQANIKVVGCGGGGNNTITRITEVGVTGSETIAINTDSQDLLYTSADRKILIGRDVTRGMGAGSDPKLGTEAAKENEMEIKSALQGADMVFITCGLGGGTGTGSAPVVADIAKRLGALTVAVVTMPFTMEGNRRYENALAGLEKLEQISDTLIVIPNDKLLDLAPDLPLNTAFKVADEILTNAVKGIAELVTRTGLVNLDFADIRAVMQNGGVALIGVGESDSEKRADEAVDKALSNPLLDVDITGATGALINIAGNKDLSLNEARKIVETVSQRLSEDAKIIWGAQIYEDMGNTVRATLIVTGVKSPQIFGTAKLDARQKKDIELELGIEFVE